MKCIECGHATRVLETRSIDGVVPKRRRHCPNCGLVFETFELSDRLEATVKKHALKAHIHAVKKRWSLWLRNKAMADMAIRGEKHAVIAELFGVADNTVSTAIRGFLKHSE